MEVRRGDGDRVTSTTIRIDKAKLDRAVANALDNPRARATLSRIANEQGRKTVAIAKELAEAELHRRPANRRTAESLAHGKEYHDSFGFRVDMSNPVRVRVHIYNDHPAAGIIEHGSEGHTISSHGPLLRFPDDPALAPGGIFPVSGKHPNFRRGAAGVFPMSGPPWRFQASVEHPGTKPHRILIRALDRYRKATRNR